MTTRPSRRQDNPPPRTGGDERDVLVGFLDYLRASIAAKAEGVPEPHVRTAGVPSGTNLLGLIKHLTSVERATFLGENVTDWPATFHAGAAETVPQVLGTYRDAVDQANEHIAGLPDMTTALSHRKQAPSLRWALVHMIEETGRHAGHADILRELIDGRTGR
uniref:Mini-circle protein n=1 Tax=uncultured Nocardioidaceae bacterium TaxID=253824 RepID=A0A6J4KUN9_9ACTN|nr:MAG: Protein of unknown function DUF664 [uncultured Nocardioidaceae bacterium]